MKKGKSFVFSRKCYFSMWMSSFKSFMNCKHICVEFDCDSIFVVEINTLEQDFPDL